MIKMKTYMINIKIHGYLVIRYLLSWIVVASLVAQLDGLLLSCRWSPSWIRCYRAAGRSVGLLSRDAYRCCLLASAKRDASPDACFHEALLRLPQPYRIGFP